MQYPPLALSFTQAHLCYSQFATYHAVILRRPIKQTRKRFAILSLQASRDMRRIAAGPLSVSTCWKPDCHSHCMLASRFGICVADNTFWRGNISTFHVATAAEGSYDNVLFVTHIPNVHALLKLLLGLWLLTSSWLSLVADIEMPRNS